MAAVSILRAILGTRQSVKGIGNSPYVDLTTFYFKVWIHLACVVD
jgi:hypothetical protein